MSFCHSQTSAGFLRRSLGADGLTPLPATGLPLCPAHCERVRGIWLPPAWGFHDSPTSSLVDKAPTQGLAVLPLHFAFSKDNPPELYPTSCQSDRVTDNSPSPWVHRAPQGTPAATAGIRQVIRGGCRPHGPGNMRESHLCRYSSSQTGISPTLLPLPCAGLFIKPRGLLH